MIDVIRQTVLVTGFVFVMMLVIEYVNVLTSGAWRTTLARNRWGQYFLAAFLGVLPGCLGAFAVVAMYAHRLLGLGAVVAAMIATAGDEQFVMLALTPRPALVIFGICFVLGILAGALTDFLGSKRWDLDALCCDGLEIHSGAEDVRLDAVRIRREWREIIAARGILAVMLVGIIAAILLGQLESEEWNWIKVTLLVTSFIALFIVSTVPDHFLEEHLWEHIARRHLPRIFLWTFGALLVIWILLDRAKIDVASIAASEKWLVLLLACLIGLIPESGPHMIFVTLFAKGAIPFSILLASSIVQDGHGMIPMLAQSRRTFFVVKAINLAVGLAVGAAALGLGF